MPEPEALGNAPRNEVAAAETPPPSSLFMLAIGVVAVAALYLARDVLLPIVLAVLLSFVLAPFVSLLRRWRLGRAPSVVVAMLVALGVLASLAGIIGLQVAQLASDLPRYEQTIRMKASALRDGVLGRVSGMVKHLGREIDRATDGKPEATSHDSAPAEAEPKPLPVEVHEPEPSPAELARQFIGPIVHPLAMAFITFIVAVFILMQREDLRDRMIRLFGARDLHRTTAAMDDAARRLSRYFLLQLAMNTGFGLWTALGLWLIGLPSPLLWGVVAAVMRFVPYIGSFIAGALPVALAAAVDPGWTMVLLTLGFFLVSEPLMGHVVEPLVYGQSTGLSPFAVVVAAIFWTWLWGPIGLLISTPLTLCLVVLGRHIERLEFLDVIFGDRPALSPAENFYQRILAGDPDEALEQAEVLLKERSLSSYYDEVVVKGLQLASKDAARGVLTESQSERLCTAVRDLVQELSSHPDVDPHPDAAEPSVAGAPIAEKAVPKDPPVEGNAPELAELPEEWRGEAAVLCIAGRGALGEAIASMLAQLLRKRGLGARVVPHEAVSRSNILNLDVSGVAMVCVLYAEIAGSPAHLRYLVRRLRQRLPEAPILVGLWPEGDVILTDKELQSAVGADHLVSSLRDAVAACLKEAREAARSVQQALVEQAAE